MWTNPTSGLWWRQTNDRPYGQLAIGSKRMFFQQSRRDFLRSAAAITTTTSIEFGNLAISQAQQTNNSPASLAQIDATLRQATEVKEVPGVVAMAATDKGVLYEGVFGLRDLSKGPAMTRDTVFRIASMTKAITSVAAMQLVEQGKLKLNEPVPDIDPALSAPQVLTGFDAAGPRNCGLRGVRSRFATFSRTPPDLVMRCGTPTRSAMSRPPGCHRLPVVRSQPYARRSRSIRASAGSTASTSIGSAASLKRLAGSR